MRGYPHFTCILFAALTMTLAQTGAFRVPNNRDERRRPLLSRFLSYRNETNMTRSSLHISTSEIPVMYRGLFFQPHQIRELMCDRHGQPGLSEEGISRLVPGDGDQCCATEIQLHSLTYLENENGRRYIVSLDDSYNYQYIPIGTCVRDYGICHGRLGRCTVEKVARTVLVWTDPELSPPFAFEWFNIPNHCTCRNVPFK